MNGFARCKDDAVQIIYDGGVGARDACASAIQSGRPARNQLAGIFMLAYAANIADEHVYA